MRIWLYLLLTAIVLTGCNTTSQKASPSPQSKNNVPRAQSTAHDGRLAANNTGNPSQLSKQAHLEQLVKRVPGVKGARCVIMGNTAVVGIDVDGKLERARVGNIKYTVAEALRKDPHGAGAVVTADVDLNNRLSEIGAKIRQGHPVSGFATELADIIGRIMPQMPRDTVPKTENYMQGRKPGATGNKPSTKSYEQNTKTQKQRMKTQKQNQKGHMTPNGYYQ
ncbi:YhcN/YlaJ family sporulation lipoprotein [Paenibacillus fonticola]|uniref:YhcN/YlaJ family sporulation lipoprotein n=1 Tax=Paenibacillus fonticola TaxID=379896 RepID=UPI0003668B39|nr:YhcN/YlaJ family sporulation lipoprotein [Paenibacillus fonticola]